MRTEREWIITDRKGGFAMGAIAGPRSRKYHGFYCSMPGRGEAGYLLDFELEAFGKPLWPHRYTSPSGPVVQPEPAGFSFRALPAGPSWSWKLEGGTLALRIESPAPGSIEIYVEWSSRKSEACPIRLRPLFGMRELHALGGQAWSWVEREGFEAAIRGAGREIYVRHSPELKWKDEGCWYHGLWYSEELARGYPAEEELFSGGYLAAAVPPGRMVSLRVSERTDDLRSTRSRESGKRTGLLDFVLRDPAGIGAGYPWFGEWGRDTFVSLPGITLGWLHAGGDRAEVWDWAKAVLLRWGKWIETDGALPNLIERGGGPQWESADATLWWCHSLAALWSASLSEPEGFLPIQRACAPLLAHVLESIR
ncbi:MAG TPA: glycogen debranching enzyme N-terminal domain-containing protein, partial [Bdellovibrionota bacterium]|nr:glycogen debranching enzyme N-terminal domain-containing protein [Bdellovibrionota bacterium]